MTHKKFLTTILICLIVLSPSIVSAAEKECEKIESEGDTYTYCEDEWDTLPKAYKGIHYTAGVAGSYFAKSGQIDIDGTVGIYSDIEFRITRAISLGFDTFYGWMSGTGNQYLSSFNPGVKIYPMLYKNPTFEPFIFLGGHVFDAILGSSQYDRLGMGQGGFGGLGFKWQSRGGVIGMQFFVRASILSMQKTQNLGGRELIVPIYSMLGVTY